MFENVKTASLQVEGRLRTVVSAKVIVLSHARGSNAGGGVIAGCKRVAVGVTAVA